MVTLSFSHPGLLYAILAGHKHQTFRCHKNAEEEAIRKKWKWDDVLKRFEAGDVITLNTFWKQRSPTEHLKIGDVPLTGIERYDMHGLNEVDAIADGAKTLPELEQFFELTYGPSWRDREWFKITWAEVPNAKLVKPNKTVIDWFEELYTINPLLFPDGCPYLCAYPCYARQMQCVRKLPGLIAGMYPGRIAGLQHAQKNVFIESMGDLFHPRVPDEFIRYTIEHCNAYNINHANLYFLTKNPGRYADYLPLFNRETTWLGCTLETDVYPNPEMSKAPPPLDRARDFKAIIYNRKFVSVEPVMRFGDRFGEQIADTGASSVFLGANTGNGAFPEPDGTAVKDLEELLNLAGIQVVRKGNLARICEEQATPEPILSKCGLCADCTERDNGSCRGKSCSKPECDLAPPCFFCPRREVDGFKQEFENMGEQVPKPAHYRHRKTGELGCLACVESEGDGPNEITCNLWHVQVDNRHRCKLLKESPQHESYRLQKEAKVQAAAEAERLKPKPTTLDKFLQGVG